MSLHLLLHGAAGRMGQAITAAANEAGLTVTPVDQNDDPAAVIAACDVVIDFSIPAASVAVAQLAAAHGIPLVIGTTGHDSDQLTALREVTTRVPVVWAGNYSVGITLLNHLTAVAAEALGPAWDAEVSEIHHHHKVDAPSGTAARLVEVLRHVRNLGADQVRHGREGQVGARPRDEIGVHALRGGDVVGEHTVFFFGQGERLELTHRANDRAIFAQGALRAARWVASGERAPGHYRMEDVLELLRSS